MYQCSASCGHKHEKPSQEKKVEPQPIQHQIIDGARSAEMAKTINLKDDPIDWNLLLYFLLGTVVYYVACGPFTYLFSQEIFPSTDTGTAF